MFTGLVEDRATVTAVTHEGNGRRFAIRCGLPIDELRLGDSIAVDGVCLTVESLLPDGFEVVLGQETLDRTTAGEVTEGRQVHLERALRVGDRLGGHMVQGHVDAVGRVRSSVASAESVVLWLSPPPEISRYIAVKGSIAVDGVSLTVNELDGRDFRVNIIPHTARVTRLTQLKSLDRVNLEVDVIAKYVERLLCVRDTTDAHVLRPKADK